MFYSTFFDVSNSVIITSISDVSIAYTVLRLFFSLRCIRTQSNYLLFHIANLSRYPDGGYCVMLLKVEELHAEKLIFSIKYP
jgi:hypothetical protein